MPAKEIKELRESGKLEEALMMAQNELEANPENIWGKRNLAWVFYAFLKKQQGNQDEFIAVLNKVIELKMPENENLFFEQFCWVIGGHIFKVSKSELSNTDKFNSVKMIFETLTQLKLEQSKGHSFLLKSFHNAFKEVPSDGQFNIDNFIDTSKNYLEVFQWAGFKSFLEEDFAPFEINGRKIMSFVEQVIIAYAKVLIKGERVEDEGVFASTHINKEKVEVFLVFLDQVIQEHPEYLYTLYYKSKLLLALNRFEEAKKALVPFVKKKKNDFWVWDLLSEAYPDDVDIQIGCICKALTLNTKESFLVKVHQKLADLLVGKELFKEASIEILNSISIRKKNDWKLNNELIKYTHQEWFVKDAHIKDNKDFYHEQSLLAEELLYNNHTEMNIVVSFVNKNKKMISFVKDKTIHGFFSYKHLKLNPQNGDVLSVRLNKISDEGFYKVLTIKSNLNSESEALKTIKGLFKAVPNKDFGFVNDVFIAPDIVKENNLVDGNEIECKTILSFNKKKNEWSWRVFDIMS
jgi:tetratricopeptide (TPR) repeat protein